MRLAIYGAGAMGTVLGAFLNRAGVQTDLIDIYEEHVNKLNESGARLTGFEDFTQPVKALLPSQMEGIYDFIILFCKQTANKEAFKIIKPRMNKDSTIITLQNGFPEPSLIEAFGEERTLGGAVLWGATFMKPGVSQVTEPLLKKSNLYEIGNISGKINGRVKMAAEILNKMGPVKISTNLIAFRWSKLLFNSCMSGMSAALGCTFGEVVSSKSAMKQLSNIGQEAGAVCKAAGQNFASYGIVNVDKIVKRTDWIGGAVLRLATKIGYRNMAACKASMLQDLERGKKTTEVDMINGYISQLGKKYGVPTPANDAVVEIVHGIENGKYSLSMDNIKYFRN